MAVRGLSSYNLCHVLASVLAISKSQARKRDFLVK